MMKDNVVAHLIYDDKKWKRNTLFKLICKKSFRRRFFRSDFFFQHMMQLSPIPRKKLQEIALPHQIVLEDFFSRNGNVSPYELMAICALIVHFKPQRLLEIGTFDGNTSLQMALNISDTAMIHTLDLPPGQTMSGQPILNSDLKFIEDEEKNSRKFMKHSRRSQVKQHFGDSTLFDFSIFIKEGLLDFIFVDGGHSYGCVKSDTENALKVLSEEGMIVWHDFTPHFGDVFKFLCELSRHLPLVHIEETNLVFYKKEIKR